MQQYIKVHNMVKQVDNKYFGAAKASISHKKSRIRDTKHLSTTSFHYFSPRIPNLNKYWTSEFGKWGQKDRKTLPQK